MSSTLVIIPTYNEKENIPRLLTEVCQTIPEVHVLVVDDNSPDGTAKEVKNHKSFETSVFLLSRPGKSGLGKAYLAGFQWALERNYSKIIEMDADFSHSPRYLPKLIEALDRFDFAVNSRYVAGGGTLNWGLVRKLVSRGGSLYSRFILGYPIADWTGGFNGWRASTLKSIALADVKSEGYCFQIELKFRSLKQGLSFIELPIVFEDRRVGQSKMSLKIVLEAFYRVWILRFLNL